jgi:hypothetical protein
MMIDGVEYVPVNSDNPFVIVRSDKAGVFAGYMRECDDKLRTVILDKCIRLWRWTGCSLSQVANDGIAGKGENKFSMKTNNHKVLEVIEIIPCTEEARIAIQSVPTWKI